MTEFLGNIAALLTTLSFLPQAIKTIRSGDTRDLSLPMYIMFTLGVFLWMIYGIFLELWPVIIGNLITFIFAGIILGYKIKNELKKPNRS